jgi:hypothetical protein
MSYKITKPYVKHAPTSHVDYVFACCEKIKSIKLLEEDEWIYKEYHYEFDKQEEGRSNHRPLVVDIEF